MELWRSADKKQTFLLLLPLNSRKAGALELCHCFSLNPEPKQFVPLQKEILFILSLNSISTIHPSVVLLTLVLAVHRQKHLHSGCYVCLASTTSTGCKYLHQDCILLATLQTDMTFPFADQSHGLKYEM